MSLQHERSGSSTHLVFLHHFLDLVADSTGVMGHGEVWLPAEPVPADVGVITELLLQANPESLCIRGSIQTTLLRGNATLFIRLLFQVWG